MLRGEGRVDVNEPTEPSVSKAVVTVAEDETPSCNYGTGRVSARIQVDAAEGCINRLRELFWREAAIAVIFVALAPICSFRSTSFCVRRQNFQNADDTRDGAPSVLHCRDGFG